MRLSKSSDLVLLCATAWAAPLAAQMTNPPPSRPFVPPDDCYTQVVLSAPFNNLFARRLVGDEWISGCIGAEGPCKLVLWVPC